MNELILDYTRVCNSRCITCNIWKIKEPPTLSWEIIKEILDSETCKNLSNLYIGGGEPTSHPELFTQIATYFHSLKGSQNHIVTATMNGLATQRTVKITMDLKNAGVPIMWQFSLNGNKETHDWSRGINGAFEKTTETIKEIAKMGVAFNISFIKFPKDRGEGFIDEDYKFVCEFAEQFGAGVELVEHTLSGKRYDTPSVFIPRWEFNCPALRKLFVINPYGEVRACEKDYDFLTLGNLHEKSLDQIMAENKDKVIKMIDEKKCQPCDLICFYNKRI